MKNARLLLIAGLLEFACYPYEEDANTTDSDAVVTPSDVGDAGVTAPPPSGTLPPGKKEGLSCEVSKTIAARCINCHGANPAGGASFSLLTLADFKKASSVPNENIAQRSLARMQSSNAPMPPAPSAKVPASEMTALMNWIQSGYAEVPCGSGSGGGSPPVVDPYNTPDVCTSGKTSTAKEGFSMRPGEACIACHTREGEGTPFRFAGTVYPTAHEPDRCVGVNLSSGVQVIIIDRNGVSHPLNLAGAAGNFGTTSAIPTPYTAKVVYQGRERVMATPQTNGDCNTCHTVRGANGAPGRIMLP